MNPIVDKLGDRPKEWLQKGNELFNPMFQKLNDRRKEWFTRGNEMWTELHERHGKFFERGQAAFDKGQAALDRSQVALGDALEAGQKMVSTFETNVLTKISSILEWAYTATGEKSDTLHRTQEFITERLEELKKQEAEAEVGEGAEKAASPAGTAAAEQETAKEESVHGKAEASSVPMPFEGYNELTAKEIAEKLEGMSKEELTAVRAYEQATKGRKTVLEALDRLG